MKIPAIIWNENRRATTARALRAIHLPMRGLMRARPSRQVAMTMASVRATPVSAQAVHTRTVGSLKVGGLTLGEAGNHAGCYSGDRGEKKIVAFLNRVSRVAAVAFLTVSAGASVSAQSSESPDVLRSTATQQATEYQFSAADDHLLEAIQRGCFQYLWNEVGPISGLVKDRRLNAVCSLAGVGFQLSSLPIGVERGWITRQQGHDRALSVLRTLSGREDNRKHGVFLHFVDLETGGILGGSRSGEASTVDHALFLAGSLPAAEYFGGEVATIIDGIVNATNWKAFDVSKNGFISFGWKPDQADLAGPGAFLSFDWHFASDEELLVYFMACGAPRGEFAGEPRDYYRLERNIKRHGAMEPFVASWNGSMFTYFFAHCWIDYRGFAADDPSKFGVENPRVDWFENSRRATLTHRQRCIEAQNRFATLAVDRWGFAPCTGLDAQGKDSYLVQALQPNIVGEDVWDGGTVAPYAAGSAIPFTPDESMAALRAYRALKDEHGEPLVWRDPAKGGSGLADSFNLDQQHASDDHVAIDAGPMLLAIENVRSGLVWRLFMRHPVAHRAVAALKMQPRKGS